MSYERVDLERLDETFDDLSAWAYDEDEDAQARARDERRVRATLYGTSARTGMVAASPIDPPIT